MINIDTYEQMLKDHNWDYNYSTDRQVWAAGNLSYQEILKHSNDSKEHNELFLKYKKKHGLKT